MIHGRPTENPTKIRVSGFAKESVVDGPGIRFVIFVQGCQRGCPECHNPQTHDLQGGMEVTIDEILAMIDSNPLLDGVTFSGGEPFLQAKALAELAAYCRNRNLSIVVYTGFYYEEILADSDNQDWRELLKLTDILIDGPFEREKRTTAIAFRGSSNQRLLHPQVDGGGYPALESD
ncbi:MAG: anaerobic ribonucleoside-triphosphate reductase activating protein [Planctomycetaceae bacterium]|jgi:anaerobic ribonucleoside-triphosphate reductase activating protein|nr:anaerobic ribonucleoside-triphosphate reductase activating protein [Planctomycetaceae bacterium]